ncbi:hypothetical protein A8139_14975 [Marinomonas primoryensis]|uniref:Uncharacterized protein n=1 Tax=Marinomonas primoryensis TaxID=178399 RepID=A0A2Z4PUC8_9GAMM|nr:hypothetical protein [Marinomonas primoryensis]AWY01133.1 hypothetical protein A8139_14975 [Marinomonas primoryensis]
MIFKISTSVLKDHFAESELQFIGDVEPKQWLGIDLHNTEHLHLLKVQEVEVPFIDESGRFVTFTDLPILENSPIFFKVSDTEFTELALLSAYKLCLISSKLDDKAKSLGRALHNASTEDDYYRFCNIVCEWGRGHRVWSNLKRHHKDRLGFALKKWLSAVGGISDEQAITIGASIKGLGVSFASKQLRFLDPNRFVVLDDVFCQGLGIALNSKGYELFLSILRQLQQQLAIELPLGDLEQGLFYLVRQKVRQKTDGSII